jgi:hypothetical protein
VDTAESPGVVAIIDRARAGTGVSDGGGMNGVGERTDQSPDLYSFALERVQTPELTAMRVMRMCLMLKVMMISSGGRASFMVRYRILRRRGLREVELIRLDIKIGKDLDDDVPGGFNVEML